MKINSIIFHTSRLKEVREFYEGKLGLKIGTFEKDGVQVADCSDSYVNYNLHGTLLCFEFEKDRTDLGTIVLSVPSVEKVSTQLKDAGVVINGNSQWLKVKDPEGRSLIVELSLL